MEITSIAQAFADLRSDYNMAKESRFRRRRTGVSGAGYDADWHVRSEADLFRMMELGRDFDRNDVVVGQGITRLLDSILPSPFVIDPLTGNDDANAWLRAKWVEWSTDAEQCHAAGELDYHQIKRLALRHTVVDGDHVLLGREDGTLEPIEAHRIRTPMRTPTKPASKQNVVHGLLVDDDGRRREVWVCRGLNPKGPPKRVAEMKRFPIRNEDGQRQVFHLYHPRRFTMTRGISWLAPIADTVGMHDDVQFAELVKRQVASCFAIIHEMRESADGNSNTPTGPQQGERRTDTLGDGTRRTIEGIAPGMQVFGGEGYTVKGFAPNIPNPEFFPHATLILTFISINLGLPVCVLLLDPSNTNFSGYRGAIDQARSGFKAIHRWLTPQTDGAIYKWKVAQWLSESSELRAWAERDEVNIFAKRVTPPSWPYIEPNKDATGDQTIIRAKLDSRRGVLNRRGLDIVQVDAEIVADNAALIELAITAADRINSRHPDARVDWRELAGFDPKGRSPDARNRVMEDIGRAVRSGVRIAESEARAALGLSGDVPHGALMRFNDADVLQYHIENPILTINEIRGRLGDTRVPWGNVTPAEFKERLKGSRDSGQKSLPPPDEGGEGDEAGESSEGEAEDEA